MPRLPVITNSEIRCFRRCPREHAIRYVQGYRPARTAQPLAFGSLVHALRESLWLVILEGHADPMTIVEDTLQQYQADNETDPFDAVTALELIRGYHLRWEGEPLEVIEVEREFRASLRNPDTGYRSHTYDLGGKVDGIVRYEGRTLLSELKTTGEDISAGSDYWARLRLDSQVSTYYTGARSLGHEVEGCLYDVIRKPGIRPLQPSARRAMAETPEEYAVRLREDIAEQPDRYYARGMVVRTEAEQTEAARSLWQYVKTIMHHRAERFAPMNPDACMSWGRPCDFFPVCTGVASLDDTNRYRKAERAHEELSGDGSEGKAA